MTSLILIAANVKPKYFVIAVLWLSWTALALIPFFRINSVSFYPLFESLFFISSAVWFWLFITALGWHWTKLFIEKHDPTLTWKLSRILISTGFGLGFFALVILVVGTFVGVNPPIIFGSLVVLVFWVGSDWPDFFRELKEVFNLLRSRSWKIKEVLGVAAILSIACLQLSTALTPTLFFDTLRYHFGVPHLFEQLGRIEPLPYFSEANLSLNWQMIYLPQLVLSTDGTAQIFNWMTLLFIALAIGLTAGPRAFFPAAILTVSTPFLLGLSGLGNNDLGVTFILSLVWLSFFSNGIQSRFLCAGILGGIAVGIKYQAVIPAAVTCIAVALFANQDPFPKRRFFWKIGMFAIGGFIGYLPWFIRNIWLNGDPVYPFLSHWLPSDHSRGIRVLESYAQAWSHYGAGLNEWLRIPLAPWRATVADPRYFESDIGLIFWVSIPFAFWIWITLNSSARRRFQIFALSAAVGGLIWSVGPQLTRFLAPYMPAAILTVALTWTEWMERLTFRRASIPKFLSIIFASLLIVVGVWQSCCAVAGFAEPYLLRGITRREYLWRHSPLFRIAHWLNSPERSTSKTLLIGEESVFFFQNPIEVRGPMDSKWIVEEANRASSVSELKRALADQKIAFLCVNQERMNGLDNRLGYIRWPNLESRQRFEDLLKTETHLVTQQGQIRLYQLRK
jgi:hypothetical protein